MLTVSNYTFVLTIIKSLAGEVVSNVINNWLQNLLGAIGTATVLGLIVINLP